MNKKWRKRKKKELTVEQWSTRNVVHYSQLHGTLNAIHTCCGIIIIIMSLVTGLFFLVILLNQQ